MTESEELEYLRLKKRKAMSVTSPQQPSFLKSAGQFAVKEGIPLGALAAGEAVGGTAGLLGVPFTEGMSIPAGEVAGGGLGYAGGQALSKQLQESTGMAPKTTLGQKFQDFPKQAAIGAGYSLGGKALKPVFGAIRKGFPRLAEILTGTEGREFANHAKDLKATLPEAMGGAPTIPKAQANYRAALSKAGIDPKSLEFDALSTTRGLKKTFIKEVEKDIARSGEGAWVATHDLIKAYQAISDEIGAAFKAEEKSAARQLIERKNIIAKELFGRSDDIAKAFKGMARSKMARNVSTILPAKSAFLGRRALLPLLAYANPKLMAAMSPRVLSGLQMAGHAVPGSTVAAGAVGALRKLREMRDQSQ